MSLIAPARSEGYTDSPNLFSEFRNNSANYTDPMGLAAVFFHLYYPFPNYPADTYYTYLAMDPEGYKPPAGATKPPLGSSYRFELRGHKPKLLTDPKTAEKDLEKSLSTEGALVVYVGDTAQMNMKAKNWQAYLDPNGSDVEGFISGKKLSSMLASAKNSVILLAGCNSVKCDVPELGGKESALVTVESGNQQNFTNANIAYEAVNIFIETLIPRDPDAPAVGTVQQAIDAANNYLDTKEKGLNKFVLKKGNGNVSLK